jgi:hypothetical protein
MALFYWTRHYSAIAILYSKLTILLTHNGRILWWQK